MSEKYPEIQKLLVEANDWHTGWVLPWSADTINAIANELAAAEQRGAVRALREAAQQAPFPADPYGGFDHESLRAAKIQIGNWLRDRAEQIEEDQ